MKHQILLYYKYIAIKDPEAFAKEHLAFCKSLDLKGHILVATEGINEALSGTVEETEKYMETIQMDECFKDTFFKVNPAEEMAFRKMSARPRSELIALNLEEDVGPSETMGKYLKPVGFKEALLDEDAVVIDARNDYGYNLGHFRGTVRPDVRSFCELPQWIRENKEQLMNKRVITYYTGGICCGKFSGRLLKGEFEDVAQLHGDAANYGKSSETHDKLWDGRMYVLDDRVSVKINHVDKGVVGKDWFDRASYERYTNCANPECNRRILTSEENERKHLGDCSLECSRHPANHYVKKHNLTEVEVAERLALLEAAGV